MSATFLFSLVGLHVYCIWHSNIQKADILWCGLFHWPAGYISGRLRLNKEQRTWYICALWIIQLYESLSLSSAAQNSITHSRITSEFLIGPVFVCARFKHLFVTNICSHTFTLCCEIYMWQFYEHLNFDRFNDNFYTTFSLNLSVVDQINLSKNES